MIPWGRIDSDAGNRSDPNTTIERVCPVCGSSDSHRIQSFVDFQFYTDSAELPRRVDIHNVACAACFAVFLNPVYTPTGFQSLFGEAGCSYGAKAGRSLEQKTWLDQRGLMQTGSCLLDVGCYDGEFLSQLPDSVARIGVDIDSVAIERGRTNYGPRGIEFICGDFSEFQIGRVPNTITMFHVLEHLPDPVKTLATLHSKAGLDTRLVIEVPVLENGFTNDINGFFSATHLTHFSRRSLENTLSRSGWKVLERFEHPDFNGCRVMAAPVEAAQRVSGDVGDVDSLRRYLEHSRHAVAEVMHRLAAVKDSKRIIIWGGGLHTEILYHTTDLMRGSESQFVIVDSDPLKQNRTWRGVSIVSPARLAEVTWSETKLIVSTYGGQPAVAALAIEYGVPTDCLTLLYESVSTY